MEIEIAKLSEINAINQLIESSKRHWGYNDKVMNLWLPDLLITTDNFSSLEIWVMKNKKVMGGVFSLSLMSEYIYELEDFWISPSEMGKGFGQKMFQFIINHLQNIKAKKLVIISDPNAEGFYKKMGASRVKLMESKPKDRMLPILELKI